MLQNFPVYYQGVLLPPGDSTRHTRDMGDQRTPQNVAARAATNFDADDTLEKAKERVRGQVGRMLHKEVLHTLIGKFVAAYMTEAKPTDPIPDLECRALLKGLREKCAVSRAAEHYGRDPRTIREAIHPSSRSRPRRRVKRS